MSIASAITNKEWKLKLLLFMASFIIYFIYFHHVFLNLNTILSSITSDAIKNYYTFVYHIKNDATALHFGGMAYPYGEHVVYTDCQPILTFIFRLLPFTHNHLIGWLHGLLFMSFIVTPVILYNILRLFDLDKFSAFLIGLAIGLLSPQYLKINAGHHGLAYACIIPLAMQLLLTYFKHERGKTLISLFAYHCFLFLLHPYMGFSVSVFAFMALFIQSVLKYRSVHLIKNIVQYGAACFAPVVLFKLFMLVTDQHANRTDEPYGLNLMVENIDSLVSPVFGPFKLLMETWFNNRVPHYEGHSYLGAFSMLLLIVLVVLLPFFFKKIKVKKEIIALVLPAFVLLLLAFGLHIKLFDALNIQVAFMNQFRATCRFAWFFYYAFSVFVTVTLYHLVKEQLSEKSGRLLIQALPLIFLSSNLWEAHYMFKMDSSVFWQFRNVFNSSQLNSEEKNILSKINNTKVQAIVPLPLFYSGSEMYDRLGFNNSMIPSMIYSFHSGLPILGSLMSRTSISETEQVLNLFNSYKKERVAETALNENKFLVIRTEKNLMPDETRLLNSTSLFYHNDSLDFGLISKADFLKPKLDSQIVFVSDKIIRLPNSNQLTYIPFENREPFIKTNMKSLSRVFVLDSNLVKSDSYVVSLRYYYMLKNYHALACDMIITEAIGDKFNWKYIIPLRFLNGFYKGYSVMEYAIEIDRNKKYEFVIEGREERSYQVSHFMLRPAQTSVGVITLKNDTVFNNFPK